MAVTGGCRCGAVRYEIAGDALPPIYACHCHVCQRATGSAFSVQALVREDRLSVTGPILLREIVTADGEAGDRVSLQRFCGECHARVYNTNSARPGVAIVRAGTLDRSEELACRAHIFTDYRQRWVQLDPQVPQWPEGPDAEAFIAALLR